jgi:hypothetical protein
MFVINLINKNQYEIIQKINFGFFMMGYGCFKVIESKKDELIIIYF